jgi:spore maturation protein CgeB
MRSFETAAMGGCMLVEDTADHRRLFGADAEAVIYCRTPQQAVDRAVRLVGEAALRRRLADRAHAVVTAGGHTYADRLQTLLSLVNEAHAPDRDRRPRALSRV